MDYSQSRRSFIKKVSAGASVLVIQPLLSACGNNAGSSPAFTNAEGESELRLSAIPDKVQLFSGAPTIVWRYTGDVIKGPQKTLEVIPDSYLGPILHLQKGQHVRVHFMNQLNESSIIHWHGLHVPESADGHPRLAISPGEEYIYEFIVMDRAGTYWYHPHPHGRTGPQVYQGLAGLVIVHDGEEDKLQLPQGAYDLPIVIQDRLFGNDNQFFYGGSPMDQMMGFLGNRLLINGRMQKDFSVESRPYRLRLLNGSNARIYSLAWSDGSPITVIGTDGGLLEKPITRDHITLAPAQRMDLWADFSGRSVGSTLELISRANSTPGGNDEFQITAFSIDEDASTTSELPQQLSTLILHDPNNAVNAASPRQFDLQMGMGMTWNINGRTFEMEKVANDERVRLGDLEIWQFNNTGGMGMLLPHPMHIHGLQFQIIERRIDSRYIDRYDSVSSGLVDEGWHDTVLVMPGEQVLVLIRFEDYQGLFLYHCHNLEHEDMGMMRNYRVVG